ncbi:MAG: hypothetical protein U9R21_09720 [Candidatus Thermoplasmatota archaeon]|nr:hypothetical protein [Candidatus Thermoplasmatota archaeon]
MVKVFDKNMFVMLFAVMIGIVVITYFMADIMHQSTIESLTAEHVSEIGTIEGKNINFTSNFLESSVLLDSAREDRAFGNYHFDLASLFYSSALSEKNISIMELHKNRTIDNCTKAMPMYFNSHLNFKSASNFFNNTKKYTKYDNYLELLDLYINLTESGAKLTMLRYNASKYLKYLTENITVINGSAALGNVSDLMDLFNETMIMYSSELDTYDEYEDDIDEYDIEGFSTIREPS